MSRTETKIPTPEGDARAFIFKPDAGQGPWPAVIIFMDAPAIRQSLFDMGERLASQGYYALLPDMFWRAGPYAPFDAAVDGKDDESRRAFFGKLRPSTDPERQVRDTAACLEFLSRQPEVKGDKVGVTGYCMGGGMALRAAAAFPDRVVAAGAFHPGGLATDAPDSPHLLASKIKAKVVVGGADQDASFEPAQKDRLDAALRAAGVDAQVDIYPGARHGYVPSDMAAHNLEAAERHWRELFGLLDETLKTPA